jgi:hypothetical protein
LTKQLLLVSKDPCIEWKYFWKGILIEQGHLELPCQGSYAQNPALAAKLSAKQRDHKKFEQELWTFEPS